jgi:NhaP-type Na+/H+ or K+/H+ antiporter
VEGHPIVGGLTWSVLALLVVPVGLIYCLLFGALISPTDLATLR